jgi:hypothetical protein
MKKIFYLKDSAKFWEVFSQERRKEREGLRKLSFAKKIEYMDEMRKRTEPFRKLCERHRKKLRKNTDIEELKQNFRK